MHAMKMLFSKTLPGRKDSKSSIHNETCTQSHEIKPDSKLYEELDSKIVDSKECEFVIENDDNNNTRVLNQYENNVNTINGIMNIQTMRGFEEPVVKTDSTTNDISTKELRNDKENNLDKNGNDALFSNKNVQLISKEGNE